MPVFRLPIVRFTAPAVLFLAAILTFGGVAVAQDLLSDEGAGLAETPLTGEQQAQQLMEAGEQALAEGDWQTALAAYDPLVRMMKAQPLPNPLASATFYTSRGRAFLGLDDKEAALTDFNSAVEASEDYLPVRIYRGNLYLDVNQPLAALGDFQKAVELHRLNTEALFGLGKSYVLLGGAQQAIRPLTYVLSAGDDNEEAVRVRAEAYRLRAQANAGILKFEDAHADIQQSLAINPDDYETYYTLGGILLQEEKFAEAAQAYQDAIDRYVPKDPESDEPYIQGYLTRAGALIEVGKRSDDSATKQHAYQAALADSDTLLELLGDSPLYATARAMTEFRRGVALRMLGQLGEAVNALTEAVNVLTDAANANPSLGRNLSEALFRRGICYYYVGEDNLAAADFRAAANIAYDDPRMRLWEGFTLARMGDQYEAIRAYGQAIAESDRYVPAYVNRGLVYLAIEDYEKAIADFDAAIRLEPTVAGHYFKRGMAHERLGDHEKAADSFTNAARFDDHFVPAYHHAADALQAMGHDELAGEYRKAAAEREAAQQPPQ